VLDGRVASARGRVEDRVTRWAAAVHLACHRVEHRAAKADRAVVGVRGDVHGWGLVCFAEAVGPDLFRDRGGGG
jgi:hypothetical protein